VKPALDRPLRFTLTPRPPAIPSLREGSAPAAAIEKLTNSDVYNFKLQQTQDVGVLVELARFELPQDPTSTP